MPPSGGGAPRKFSFTYTCSRWQGEVSADCHTGPPRWLSPAAVTNYSDLGGLKQQKCIVSQLWRLQVQSQVSEVPLSSAGSRGESLPAPPGSPRCPWLVDASLQSLPLWSCRLPSVRVCPSVHVSPFCKDTSRVGSGPTRMTHLRSICKDACLQGRSRSQLPGGRASAYLFSTQSSSVCWLKKLRRLGVASQGQDLERPLEGEGQGGEAASGGCWQHARCWPLTAPPEAGCRNHRPHFLSRIRYA